jgi:hypothetical protein
MAGWSRCAIRMSLRTRSSAGGWVRKREANSSADRGDSQSVKQIHEPEKWQTESMLRRSELEIVKYKDCYDARSQ